MTDIQIWRQREAYYRWFQGKECGFTIDRRAWEAPHTVYPCFWATRRDDIPE